MPSKRISASESNGVYFLTCTIEHWYYIFDRHHRWEIIADAIRYAQTNKNLTLYGYVFMLNHLHLLVRSPDTIGFIRDFKRHTSKELHQNLERTERNVLSLFVDENKKYKFWRTGNAPKRVENKHFFLQKLNYIHLNPVRKNYVEKADYWHWSSANRNSPLFCSPLPV